jgi:hypothetical protein
MAFDFLLGLEIPRALRSMFPKRDEWWLSPPEAALPTESEKFIGMNAGASGRNIGSEAEKLNSLWPGAKAGAPTLMVLFPLLIEWLLKWLDDVDMSGAKAEKAATGGWKLFPLKLPLKLKWLGLKELVGSNLNSLAPTLSFDIEGLLLV